MKLHEYMGFVKPTGEKEAEKGVATTSIVKGYNPSPADSKPVEIPQDVAIFLTPQTLTKDQKIEMKLILWEEVKW